MKLIKPRLLGSSLSQTLSRTWAGVSNMFTWSQVFLFVCFNFLAALGLRCCAWASSSCGTILHCVGFSLRWLLFQGTGSRHVSFSSCGTQTQQLWLSGSRAQAYCCGAWAQLLHGMWDLPGPGLEPVSPALAGRFLTTAPPGKPRPQVFIKFTRVRYFKHDWLRLQSLSIFPPWHFPCFGWY